MYFITFIDISKLARQTVLSKMLTKSWCGYKYNFFPPKKTEMNGSPRHDMDVDCEKEPARQKVPHCKYKISITRASHCGSVCLSVSVNVLHLDN